MMQKLVLKASACLITLATVAALNEGFAMNESDETMPMRLRRITGTETISSDIALRLAGMVFEHNYGKEVTEKQLPLVIEDLGDRWQVRGSNVVPSSPDLSDPLAGELKITIMKSDGRIVDLVRELAPRP